LGNCYTPQSALHHRGDELLFAALTIIPFYSIAKRAFGEGRAIGVIRDGISPTAISLPSFGYGIRL